MGVTGDSSSCGKQLTRGQKQPALVMTQSLPLLCQMPSMPSQQLCFFLVSLTEHCAVLGVSYLCSVFRLTSFLLAYLQVSHDDGGFWWAVLQCQQVRVFGSSLQDSLQSEEAYSHQCADRPNGRCRKRQCALFQCPQCQDMIVFVASCNPMQLLSCSVLDKHVYFVLGMLI